MHIAAVVVFVAASVIAVPSTSQAQTTCTYGGVGGAIPDDDFDGYSSTITVPDDVNITGLEVSLAELRHTKIGDLTIILFSPDPDRFVSIMNNAADNDTSNLDGTYVFSNAGASIFAAANAVGGAGVIAPGTYRASRSDTDTEDLDEQFVGTSAMGTWRVEISDGQPGNVGSVGAIELRVATDGTCGADQGPVPAATSCWNFNGDFSSTNPIYNGVVGAQAPGFGTNDAQVSAANPSPAGGSNLLLDGDGDYLWAGRPLVGAGSFTKTMWLYRTGSNVEGSWENLYASGDPGGPHSVAIDPDNNGSLLVWHRGGSGPGVSAAPTGQTIPTGQWVHVAVVYDAVADALTTHVNGVASNALSPVGTLGPIDGPDSIGAYAGMQSWFNGRLDDVCIFAVALSQAELTAMAMPGTQATTCNGATVTVNIALGEMPTANADVIMGTPGNDVIAAQDGDDIICGGGGDDSIWGQGGNDWIDGEAGDDRLRGGAGDDIVRGSDGADNLTGGQGDDDVLGGAGDDVLLRGNTGDDLLDGGEGNEVLIAGNGGLDIALGGGGNDKVTGGPRPDELEGGPGNDELKGHKGADTLLGEDGNDQLFGGQQPDSLDGGAGVDTCNGGTTGNPAIESDTAINCETETNIP